MMHERKGIDREGDDPHRGETPWSVHDDRPFQILEHHFILCQEFQKGDEEIFRFPSSKFHEFLRHYTPFGIEKDIGRGDGDSVYEEVHMAESYFITYSASILYRTLATVFLSASWIRRMMYESFVA